MASIAFLSHEFSFHSITNTRHFLSILEARAESSVWFPSFHFLSSQASVSRLLLFFKRYPT